MPNIADRIRNADSKLTLHDTKSHLKYKHSNIKVGGVSLSSVPQTDNIMK